MTSIRRTLGAAIAATVLAGSGMVSSAPTASATSAKCRELQARAHYLRNQPTPGWEKADANRYAQIHVARLLGKYGCQNANF
ncbi:MULTISPECIES: hypothetical protein [unclassified Luteococcus]|uniref:hypothetical protein n=1 Tax=unclassified Luteococcus TaxID=2639923 RepID=UPI00313ED0BD